MVFKIDECERADWPLLQNRAVNLFWNMEIYKGAIVSLEELGYRTIKLRFENAAKFTNDVSEALKWKQQFGYEPLDGDLNALNDGLRGQPFYSADDSAICIENFNLFAKQNKHDSSAFLNILERTSRNYLLFGKRLIALIQTTDPRYRCDNIGGTYADWNEAEWFNWNRGL